MATKMTEDVIIGSLLTLTMAAMILPAVLFIVIPAKILGCFINDED